MLAARERKEHKEKTGEPFQVARHLNFKFEI
jgi:hypothetical protein